ncbi:MAG TPA: membrane protein insertion efficiency factor YidD [Myxococcales bacterium]|nr:membrane protein insertion efficiency factor YidD [Myxococcales bacterium]
MIARLLIGLVKAYQVLLSPLMGGRCRFHPSCSAYSIDYLKRHGAIAGAVGTIWRLLRCSPWGGQGEDPVPDSAWNLPHRKN